jgi:hypothetical protein
MKSGNLAGLMAIAAMAEMGAMDNIDLRKVKGGTSSLSTLNGKQKAARKAKNKAAKAARKRNR